MNSEVAHRGVGQIKLQRLPVLSVVEGNIDRAFGAGKKQTFARGILAYCVAHSANRNATGDFSPGLAEVASAVNVGAQIVKAKAVDRGVRRAGIEVRSFDNGNFAPGL